MLALKSMFWEYFTNFQIVQGQLLNGGVPFPQHFFQSSPSRLSLTIALRRLVILNTR